MLYEILDQYKNEIIKLSRDKVLANGDSKPTTVLLDDGLPLFYDELIWVLRRTASTTSDTQTKELFIENNIKGGDAAIHGKESLRLGYTLSQVVHSYGAVCQSITEFVQDKKYKITNREFQDLNLSLDCAIAEAVTEYEIAQKKTVSDREVERLGFLMHEMRNSLSAASAAHQMIRKGSVGVAGTTSDVLGRSHARMQRLIEDAEIEIRLHGHVPVQPTQIRLTDIINEVYEVTLITGNPKKIQFKIDVDPTLRVTADRRLVFSALSNLVNNAMKFTKEHGSVSIRGRRSGARVLLEVEDECGGLVDGKTEDIFKLFVQKRSDKTGMGLGLPLSRKAIELNQGSLTVSNIPGQGCIFTIDLPKREEVVQSEIKHP